MEWIFDGIGTAIIVFIFGLTIGSGTTYGVMRKKYTKINQHHINTEGGDFVGRDKND